MGLASQCSYWRRVAGRAYDEAVGLTGNTLKKLFWTWLFATIAASLWVYFGFSDNWSEAKGKLLFAMFTFLCGLGVLLSIAAFLFIRVPAILDEELRSKAKGDLSAIQSERDALQVEKDDKKASPDDILELFQVCGRKAHRIVNLGQPNDGFADKAKEILAACARTKIRELWLRQCGDVVANWKDTFTNDHPKNEELRSDLSKSQFDAYMAWGRIGES